MTGHDVQTPASGSNLSTLARHEAPSYLVDQIQIKYKRHEAPAYLVEQMQIKYKRCSGVPATAVEESIEGSDAEARSLRSHRRDRAPLVVQRVVALPC